MSANQQEKPKKSFEFRMSKKVAELTQVVHMLFTRNHEKEVEIDALKKSYEKEIDFVIADAKGKIVNLETLIEGLKRKSDLEIERARVKTEGEATAKENEWRKRLGESEKLLQEERSECQNVRDLLINAQKDIEKLRQGVTDELSSKCGELRQRDNEVERLRAELSSADAALKISQKDAQNMLLELEKSNERLEEELRQLRNGMDNSHKTRDQLLTRNKQLEHDMKTLKREFNKRAAEIANNQLRNARNNLSLEANEELERLRREVQRYRLEISNRDNNFNRMFTDKQPVLLFNQRQNSSSISAPSASASASSKPHPNALYTSYNGASSSSPAQSAGPSGLRPSGNANFNATTAHSSIVGASFSQERQPTRNGFMDNGNRLLERQTTFPEKSDRIFQNTNGNSDHRLQTQGYGFANERLLSNNDRHHHNLIKQQLSPIFQDDPSQLMPQPQRPGPMSLERPTSSSLPSICSTPERRHSKQHQHQHQHQHHPHQQLAKPKPLSREMLYGK